VRILGPGACRCASSPVDVSGPITFLLFGASGDLAGRFLLPALAALQAAGRLPDGLQVVGTSREDWDDAAFRRVAAERLEQHASEVPAAAREELLASLRYRRVDLNQPEDVARAVRGEDASTGPIVAYLALPPGMFAQAVSALGEAGLPTGSRIAIEKPFGEDLASAVALNELLARVAGDAGEEAIFRIDHVLGMATAHNLLGLRFANGVTAPLWTSDHIEQVEILWEETLALEGRAGYFDSAGTLKDVLQNHALQVLSLVAMETPAGFGQRELRDRKLEALRSIHALDDEQMTSRTRRARYTAGRVDERVVPAYAEEDGVDASRSTETFAELVLELDSERWAGTRFVLRAGKALGRRRKGVLVRFRPPAQLPFEGAEPPGNELWIGIDGPEDLRLELTGSTPAPSPRSSPLTLAAPPPASELPPYARVLQDVLEGDGLLSVRGDEAEEAWRIMDPVLRAWADDRVPLEEYPAGSDGPS
jgi:glucose-6-phosphate 1-dehydrogenase